MLKITTPPARLPLTLGEAKDHIRVTFSDDDFQIQDMIRTATERLDGPEGYLGRCLITQTWEYTTDRFASVMPLPLPPLQAVESITYLQPDGSAATLDPADFIVSGIGDLGSIRPAPGKGWPHTYSAPDAVAIRFTAGYGDNAEDVPEPIRAAIKLRVGHMYDNRNSVVIGDSVSGLPLGEDDLIRNYRLWGF